MFMISAISLYVLKTKALILQLVPPTKNPMTSVRLYTPARAISVRDFSRIGLGWLILRKSVADGRESQLDPLTARFQTSYCFALKRKMFVKTFAGGQKLLGVPFNTLSAFTLLSLPFFVFIEYMST